MFTGLVEETGSIVEVTGVEDGVRLTVATDALSSGMIEGDSVTVNGVCLTATRIDGESFVADVVAETLRRSALGELEAGDGVNLELAVRAGGRLGGHIVQGHVDGVGEVDSVAPEGLARTVRIAAAPEILRYVVEKGSIALDGVSLTLAQVDHGGFSVAVIPETLERTTLGSLTPGRRVNLEVDILAKYVEKLLSPIVEAR